MLQELKKLKDDPLSVLDFVEIEDDKKKLIRQAYSFYQDPLQAMLDTDQLPAEQRSQILLAKNF
jgi:hypothetical protein